MRGKLISYDVDRGEYGITPAHAGKTTNVNTFFDKIKDHPRACGENLMISDSASGIIPREMRQADVV